VRIVATKDAREGYRGCCGALSPRKRWCLHGLGTLLKRLEEGIASVQFCKTDQIHVDHRAEYPSRLTLTDPNRYERALLTLRVTHTCSRPFRLAILCLQVVFREHGNRPLGPGCCPLHR
jgi:hypothetical protein